MAGSDLRTVDRALSVLDLIASEQDAEWGLAELGKARWPVQGDHPAHAGQPAEAWLRNP